MVQKVPDRETLKAYLDRGLTQQQIADEWHKDSGNQVSRTAIAMAIDRYGLSSNKPVPRHASTVPWALRPEHRFHTDARYLRLEGRRRAGLPLTEDEKRRLGDWMDELLRLNAVIVYDPDTEAGFWWLERTEDDRDVVRY